MIITTISVEMRKATKAIMAITVKETIMAIMVTKAITAKEAIMAITGIRIAISNNPGFNKC